MSYYHLPRVLSFTQWGATLELRLWPTPLGPPPGHVPGRLSARARRRSRSDALSAAAQTCCKTASLVFSISIIGPTRGSRDGVRRRWRVSRAGRPRLGLGEAVGRAAAFSKRVQMAAGQHQHDTNYHRRGAAQGARWRRWAATCLRGCSSAAAAWGRSRRVYPHLRPAARRSGTSAARGRRRPKWSPRGVKGLAAATVSAR